MASQAYGSSLRLISTPFQSFVPSGQDDANNGIPSRGSRAESFLGIPSSRTVPQQRFVLRKIPLGWNELPRLFEKARQIRRILFDNNLTSLALIKEQSDRFLLSSRFCAAPSAKMSVTNELSRPSGIQRT